MRASPNVQVSLTCFGLWRGAVWAIALAAISALAAWLISHQGALAAWVMVSCALAACAVAGLAISLTRLRSTSLRWDGQAWFLGQHDDRFGDAVSGGIRVVVDLGMWMLLRFEPDGHAPSRRVTWLPVQRLGLEPQWHGLRCAVYSPQPDTALAQRQT